MDFYDNYKLAQCKVTQVEEKIIKDQFQKVVDGNDAFKHLSSSEIQDRFWLFRHGWICRNMLT